MTNAQRLQQSAALLESRAGSKPQSPEYQAQRIHQEVLESLVSTGVLIKTTPKAAKKPSKKSSAAPAAAVPPGAERAAE